MTKSIKRILITSAIILTLSVCFAVTSFAADSSISFMANAGDANTVIKTQTVNDKEYLFLPSSADLSELTLYHDNAANVTLSTDNGTVAVKSGVAFDLTALFTAEQDEYTVTVNKDGTEMSLTIMKSANVRSMYLVSDDPVNYGRAWVDTSKSNEATGLISLVGTDGEVDNTDKLTQLKGRGNATFENFEKKPYQIKLKNKVDLISGQKSEENKKWVLLANAADNTLIHNSATFALANALNMPYTPNYEPIDLYYDGEYRGAYLLCEKTEVDSSRIDIEDLDGLIEDANTDNDAYENPVVVTKTTASKGETDAAVGSKGSYKYVTGLIEPELAEGTTHHAYLLELEFSFRYPNEQSGFVTNRGQCVVTKNPEYLTKDTGAYISAFWQEFENAVYSKDGYNAATGKYYYDYCDLESLVNLYLINELGKNYDSFRSSTFFYLPEDEDIMYAGPVWDYDICYGNGHNNRKISSNPENFYSVEQYLLNGLIEIQSFRDAVKKTLDSTDGEFFNAVMAILDEDGAIDTLAQTVSVSQKMNFKIWDLESDYSIVVKPNAEKTYENAVDFFKYFIDTRINWLAEETAMWDGDNYTITKDDDTSSSSSSNSSSLSFIQTIINFFNSIIEWLKNLFR